MFPTFISILDIQSWWEVPSISHFCSLFRTAFDLLDFDIEDLEEALLTDGTEESSWLQELIVRLLSGCLANNEISTFNYQMFLRRLFREKCQQHDRYNPFNTDTDFQLLALRTKVDILHALCDFRLDADDVFDHLKDLEASSLRVEPLGFDTNKSTYWYFYGTRLYREDITNSNNKKKSIWQVICFTQDDWIQLMKKFKKKKTKCEKQLYRTLKENFVPELPRLFHEKERLARKRLLDKRSFIFSGIVREVGIKHIQSNQSEVLENQSKNEEEEDGENQENVEFFDYEMGRPKTRQKKSKSRQRKLSSGSSVTSQDDEKKTKRRKKQSDDQSSTSSKSNVMVGRQTNNSLSAATGQILIQPIGGSAPIHKKKLKTSQVFRQTDEDLVTGMHKILDFVKNHDDAWPFADPVDEDYAPNYYTIIRRPMDLQRMEDRLDAGFYTDFVQFRDDFQLIVDNCRLYNGAENEYTEMVDNLQKVFESGTSKFLDELSSDDEIGVEFLQSKIDKASKKASTKNEMEIKKKEQKIAKTENKEKKRSLSDESLQNNNNNTKRKKLNEMSNKKKDKKTTVKKIEKDTKKESNSDPLRSRSQSPTRSPLIDNKVEKFDFFSKWRSKDSQENDIVKKKQEKHKELQEKFSKLDEPVLEKLQDRPVLTPKPKDKHNTLRETIEKLKAKSKISNKLNSFNFDTDTPKENKQKTKKSTNKDGEQKNITTTKLAKKNHKETKNNTKKEETKTSKKKEQLKNSSKKDVKKNNSNKDEIKNSHKKDGIKTEINKYLKKNIARNTHKKTAIDALSIATEETLKDINKWLDDTPKESEFSSGSNSPANITTKNNNTHEVGSGTKTTPTTTIATTTAPSVDTKRENKPAKKDVKKEKISQDLKLVRKLVTNKFQNKKREIQRTIDRLQPGKSKGNLLSNPQNLTKQEDTNSSTNSNNNNINSNSNSNVALKKDVKNIALAVQNNESVPKLSLGTVLDSFGQHDFNKDKSNDENDEKNLKKKDEEETVDDKKEIEKSETKTEEDTKKPKEELPSMMSSGTPNLSAWFRAFGAPKTIVAQTNAKKSNHQEIGDEKIVPTPEISPNVGGGGSGVSNNILQSPPIVAAGATRQRRISTGSSMSERSSFSQDSSPHVGIDERLGGVYPAPYPSPLQRSPSSGGGNIMVPSPRASEANSPGGGIGGYPPFNGQMRAGFYQDTASIVSPSTKSSNSPDNKSPYHHQETQHSQQPLQPAQQQQNTYNSVISGNFSGQYSNYNFSNSNSAAPYQYHQHDLVQQQQQQQQQIFSENQQQQHQHSTISATNSSVYYDTNKSLTEQYNEKTNYNNSSNVLENSGDGKSNDSDVMIVDGKEKLSGNGGGGGAVFPMKKRIYNERDEINRFDGRQEMRTLHQLDTQTVIEETPQNNKTTTQSSPQQPQYINHPILPELSKSQSTLIHSSTISTSAPTSTITSTATAASLLPSNYPYEIPYEPTATSTSYSTNIPPATPSSTQQQPQHNINYTDTSQQRQMNILGNYTSRGIIPTTPNYSRPNSDLNYGQEIQTPSDVASSRLQSIGEPPQQQQQQQTDYTTLHNMDQGVTGGGGGGGNHLQHLQHLHSHLNPHHQSAMEGIRGSMANTLSHIRYGSDVVEQPFIPAAAHQYYGTSDKNFTNGSSQQATSNNAVVTSSIFHHQTQMSNYNHQPATVYSRQQLSDLQQNVGGIKPPPTISGSAGDGGTPNSVAPPEKKTRKRKNAKNSNQTVQPPASEPSISPATSSSSFLQYSSLKLNNNSNNNTTELNPISLKTTIGGANGGNSVIGGVPGSAFNFGPTPPPSTSSLGLVGSGIYSDKEPYSNFLEDYRNAPNYYLPPHHRTTPEASTDKNLIPLSVHHPHHHQPSSSSTSSSTALPGTSVGTNDSQSSNPSNHPYPFLGSAQPTVRPPPPGYPTPFPQLIDPHHPHHHHHHHHPHHHPAPLYQHYLQQGLLGPPPPSAASVAPPPGGTVFNSQGPSPSSGGSVSVSGGVPPPHGYHPALSIRQTYDATRHSWI